MRRTGTAPDLNVRLGFQGGNVWEMGMKDRRVLLVILTLVAIFAAGTAQATGKRKCAEDYRRFCSQWGLETRGLQNCMRAHGDRLTKACVRGLIAAGAVSQAEVDRKRAALGR